ncbi:PspC domain-containing protein [Spirillospora sp. CA-294931]|uniref:PspC domain-containing protein n=1 Tax=Spirillospora sp. CA-294931 TaxID=3240042 RepID=UPI003D91351E
MNLEKSTAKKLRRTQDGRMVAGVCSGAGRFLGVDPNIIRLAMAVFTIFGGSGLALYAIAWLVVPDEDASTSIAEDLFKKGSESPAVQDAVRKTKDAVGKTSRA